MAKLAAFSCPGFLARGVAMCRGAAAGGRLAHHFALRVVVPRRAACRYRFAHCFARRVDVASRVAGRGRLTDRATGA